MLRTPVDQEAERLYAACLLILREERTNFLYAESQENDVYYALIGMPSLRRLDFWMMKQLQRYDYVHGRSPARTV